MYCRCELVFEKCFVPEENVLGQEGKGADTKISKFCSENRNFEKRYNSIITESISYQFSIRQIKNLIVFLKLCHLIT